MAPSFFIAHGSPLLAIQDIEYTRYLRNLGSRLGKPKAVVVFSAHWTSRTLTVTRTDAEYETIYDFGGFPEEMYRIVYPAKGSEKLADSLVSLFREHGIEAQASGTRGLDHGAWVLLRHMFPEADVPVINVSVNPLLPPEEQYKIGAAVAALKDQDIVVIGSGATVHNFRAIRFDEPERQDEWAKQFDNWLIDHMKAWDTKALFDYKAQAPYAREATPDYEHFLPLYLAMGAGDRAKRAELLHQSYQYGSLSHLIIEFA